MFDPRALTEELFRAALAAVEPQKAVAACLRREGNTLSAGTPGADPWTCALDDYRRVIVVGCGKASAPMAKAVEEILGERIGSGLVVAKEGHAAGYSSRIIDIVEAGHPVPDERGRAAARAVLSMLERAGSDELVIALLSGGGSSLWPLPPRSIPLEDKRRTTEILLACGADIHETNAVRKHISLIKGGLAATASAPAHAVVLAVSDVIGDRLDVIASGPFFYDKSTYSDAMMVVEKYDIRAEIPSSVIRRLERGVKGNAAETPKEGHPALSGMHHCLCANNEIALAAAAAKARELEVEACVTTTELSGNTIDAARWICNRLTEKALERPKRPCVLLSGGETVVNLGKSSGKGGRNSELALAAAIEISGKERTALLSCGSDGTDGPTDAAGAFVDSATTAAAGKLGLDPASFLARHDSYTFFDKAGGLVRTGPTMTNVMDIQVGVVW